MTERNGAVTMKGSPLTLVGPELKVGDKAPDCVVLNTDLAPVSLSAYRGTICIIASVPSLDTPVCDIEARQFNQEAANFGPDVALLTISMDLPFAQKRWCGASGADKLVTLSDHRDASFGSAYGLLIKELRLLARSVIIIDREGIIRYIQLVRELTQEPDYEAVLKALQACM